MYGIVVYCMSTLVLFSSNMNAQMGWYDPVNCLRRATSEIPCKSANCTVVNPNNCHEYITCLAEKKPKCGRPYVGYQIGDCGEMFYDERVAECVDVFECPSNSSHTQECLEGEGGKKYGLAKSCSKYKVCKEEGENRFWEELTCPSGQYFDKTEKECKTGKCPGCFEMAPDYADCEKNKEGYKFGHIYDCNKYFTCELNQEECEEGKWGRIERTCPTGQYFDGNELGCIATDTCPQKCEARADDKVIKCKREGEALKVDLENCKAGGVCTLVKNCPDACYEEYWAIKGASCTGKYEFYHKKLQKCVKALACPQNNPPNHPPNLIWDFMAETGFTGTLLKDQSFCRAGSHKPQYEYGTFDAKQRVCITNNNNKSREVYEVISANNINMYFGPAVDNPEEQQPRNAVSVREKQNRDRFVCVCETETCDQEACDVKLAFKESFNTAASQPPYFVDGSGTCTKRWYYLFADPATASLPVKISP